MGYYNFPEVPFGGFDEDFEYREKAQMFRNLVKFCGYTSLHPRSWLYKDFLENRVKVLKSGGNECFRRWCTWPVEYQALEKIPYEHMKVNPEQMERWKQWLRRHETSIRAECSGPVWESQYRPC